MDKDRLFMEQSGQGIDVALLHPAPLLLREVDEFLFLIHSHRYFLLSL